MEQYDTTQSSASHIMQLLKHWTGTSSSTFPFNPVLTFQITGLKSFCIGKESGTYSSPSGQKSYLFCLNGITEQRECPEKMLFNPKEKICDLPDNV